MFLSVSSYPFNIVFIIHICVTYSFLLSIRNRYIPPSMQGQQETQEWWNKLYEVTAKIKERMMLEGTLMVGYTPLSYKNIGNFFRMVVTCQPPPTKASMDYVIDKIEKLSVDL